MHLLYYSSVTQIKGKYWCERWCGGLIVATILQKVVVVMVMMFMMVVGVGMEI